MPSGEGKTAVDTRSSDMAEPSRLGAHLAARLRGVVLPFVNDTTALRIVPRWDAPDAIVLIVRAARGRDVGRLVGRGGAVVDALRLLARVVGMRGGVRGVDIEVVEA